MGRPTIAQKIIDGIDEIEDESTWIVCYDFDQFTNLRQFYPNRDRLIHKLGGIMIQYSVFIGSLPASLAISELVRIYEGKVLRLELNPNQTFVN